MGLSQVKFVSPVWQFCEKANSLMVIPLKNSKIYSSYCFHSRLFTFHLLVQLLLSMVKLNRVCQPISIEYKMVHGFKQNVFRT